MPGVYSAAYGNVHYKEPLKSFEIRVGHIPGFGLPSVAILTTLCGKQYSLIHSFELLHLKFFCGLMISPAILAEKWSKEDILLPYLMVSLFIVYVIHIYV